MQTFFKPRERAHQAPAPPASTSTTTEVSQGKRRIVIDLDENFNATTVNCEGEMSQGDYYLIIFNLAQAYAKDVLLKLGAMEQKYGQMGGDSGG